MASPIDNRPIFPADGFRLPAPAKTPVNHIPAVNPSAANTPASVEDRVNSVGTGGSLFTPYVQPPPAKIAAFPAVKREAFNGTIPTPPSTAPGAPGASTASQSPHILGQGSAPMFEAAPKR